MLEVACMAKGEVVSDAKAANKRDDNHVVKVKLSVSKTDARRLGRVTRWERSSEETSLELTGRD